VWDALAVKRKITVSALLILVVSYVVVRAGDAEYDTPVRHAPRH
jgi:hypothetical protein